MAGTRRVAGVNDISRVGMGTYLTTGSMPLCVEASMLPGRPSSACHCALHNRSKTVRCTRHVRLAAQAFVSTYTTGSHSRDGAYSCLHVGVSQHGACACECWSNRRARRDPASPDRRV